MLKPVADGWQRAIAQSTVQAAASISGWQVAGSPPDVVSFRTARARGTRSLGAAFLLHWRNARDSRRLARAGTLSGCACVRWRTERQSARA